MGQVLKSWQWVVDAEGSFTPHDVRGEALTCEDKAVLADVALEVHHVRAAFQLVSHVLVHLDDADERQHFEAAVTTLTKSVEYLANRLFLLERLVSASHQPDTH